ncbi:Bro-N domain-containing protein, partial [Brucella sp. 21LCYQ03]|nr:Bro-N domain-containing protein [Brucella sp. 21LCYQ03]
PTEALRGLDSDEKLTSEMLRAGQKRKVNLISESGLYALVFKSRKPSALKFRKWITKEVIPSIRKKGFYGKIDRTTLPNFIERYKDNFHKIPKDHFSVISEMFARMYIELEKVGYVIPDKAIDGRKLVPDISVGLGFAKFLKANNSEFYGSAKKYKHTFPDGREVDANMYHIDALPMFIRYINEKWIPEKAEAYFQS